MAGVVSDKHGYDTVVAGDLGIEAFAMVSAINAFWSKYSHCG